MSTGYGYCASACNIHMKRRSFRKMQTWKLEKFSQAQFKFFPLLTCWNCNFRIQSTSKRIGLIRLNSHFSVTPLDQMESIKNTPAMHQSKYWFILSPWILRWVLLLEYIGFIRHVLWIHYENIWLTMPKIYGLAFFILSDYIIMHNIHIRIWKWSSVDNSAP